MNNLFIRCDTTQKTSFLISNFNFPQSFPPSCTPVPPSGYVLCCRKCLCPQFVSVFPASAWTQHPALLMKYHAKFTTFSFTVSHRTSPIITTALTDAYKLDVLSGAKSSVFLSHLNHCNHSPFSIETGTKLWRPVRKQPLFPRSSIVHFGFVCRTWEGSNASVDWAIAKQSYMVQPNEVYRKCENKTTESKEKNVIQTTTQKMKTQSID